MNLIKFDSPLIPGAQSWYFVIKALGMDPDLGEFVTNDDKFTVRVENKLYVMYHYNSKCNEERPLFCFEKNTKPSSKIMYQTLVHCIKETWAEVLI